MEIRQAIIDWLLDSDPAIRWQVKRDILRAGDQDYSRERAQLSRSGWCAHILGLQDRDGLWNRSLYNGKWISTTYTLYLLKLLGLPSLNPQALSGCSRLLSEGLYGQQEIRFSRTKTIQDLGVTALVLSLCCYFGSEDPSLPHIAAFLADQQCDEGNWLPNGSPSAAAYTFETTLLVLEALLQFRGVDSERRSGAVTQAEASGQEFLLRHALYLRDGMPIKRSWTSFSFPSYWFYDVLAALDYFRSYGTNKGEGLQAGIDLLLKRQTGEGIWLAGPRHPGKIYFEMETPRQPSRWQTLRALRVLKWWEGDDR